jgi:hypothetical protein
VGDRRFVESVFASVIGNLAWSLIVIVVVFGVGALAFFVNTAHAGPSTSPVVASSTSPSAFPSSSGSTAQLSPSGTTTARISSGPSRDGFCPPTYGYGYEQRDGSFEPHMVIVGPAALHALRGSYELGQALGLESVSRWGINVPAGRSVTIPSSITLLGGQGDWAPAGFYEIYASDADIASAQVRWLTYCP